MESERRHELQQNDLAAGLSKMGKLWDQHGTKILVALIVVALLIWVYRLNQGSAVAARENAQITLWSMNQNIQNLNTAAAGPPAMLAEAKQQVMADMRDRFAAMNDIDDPVLQAEALRLRGDYFWTLATLPQTPATAATQPAEGAIADPLAASTAAEESPEAYLQQAEEAYRNLIELHSNLPGNVVAAQFGLAAIAEERRELDAARELYNQILESEAASETQKAVARYRLQWLPDLAFAPRLAEPSPQPTGDPGDLLRLDPSAAERLDSPATQPAIDVVPPTTVPTTLPATQPAE